MVVETTGSALDVIYALSYGLLTLHEHNAEDKPGKEVDLGKLTESKGDETYLTLSSPVNRKQSKFEAFTTYQYHIDVNGELAFVLERGKKYTIRFSGTDLSVKWCAYGERDRLLGSDNKRSQLSSVAKVINSKETGGRATFRVVSSLPWPPKVLVSMRLCSGEDSPIAPRMQDGTTVLEFCVTNTGHQAISVQSRGHQRFLAPWGPFQPEGWEEGPRLQIVHPSESAGISILQIIDSRNDVVVHPIKRPPGCVGATSGHGDRRPKLSSIVTLKPGEPLVKCLEIGRVLAKLPDGEYKVSLQTQGVWWCFGSLAEISDEGDDRVPQRHYNTTIPPSPLGSEDVVDLQVESGKLVR